MQTHPDSLMQKYLRYWAEPDSVALASSLGKYHAALIVPVMGEPVEFLDGYRDACSASQGRVLVVAVINSTDTTEPRWIDANRVLLDTLAARHAIAIGGCMLSQELEFDLLTVDRSSDGRRLPMKQGVGLARKLGADVATVLRANGRLEQRFLYFTDADARLPHDYFWRCNANLESTDGAALFPFRHEPCGNSPIDEATELYELSIRYHVMGLAHAGSPYAYQSVGSAIAVTAEAYAAVRGVPKRLAGEDFYLLSKVAKIATLRRYSGSPISLASRRSTRAPFGTGPAVAEIVDNANLHVTAPLAYGVLSRLLGSLECFCAKQDIGCFEDAYTDLPQDLARLARAVTHTSGLINVALDAAGRTGAAHLRRRLHTWFDALRTLRFLHALRDAGLTDVPWRLALQSAPFIGGYVGCSISDALNLVVELESRLSPLVGVPGHNPS